MMKKTNIIASVATLGLALGLSSSVLADGAGDSLIGNPGNGSTVNTSTVDIYFTEVIGAKTYSIDLIGSGVIAVATPVTGACAVGSALQFEYTGTLVAADLDCTLTQSYVAADLPIQAAYSLASDSSAAGVKVCKYTTPILADGSYAIAINPMQEGTAFYTTKEARTVANCSTNDGAAAHANNVMADTTQWTDGNYQTFDVANTTATPIVNAPLTPQIIFPLSGASIFSGTNPASATAFTPNTFTFVDNSPADSYAKWYEIFIYDPAYDRVELWDTNGTSALGAPLLGYKNWYLNTSDLALSCTQIGPAQRVCEVDMSLTTALTGAPANDVFTWYVKSENAIGQSAYTGGEAFKP